MHRLVECTVRVNLTMTFDLELDRYFMGLLGSTYILLMVLEESGRSKTT